MTLEHLVELGGDRGSLLGRECADEAHRHEERVHTGAVCVVFECQFFRSRIGEAVGGHDGDGWCGGAIERRTGLAPDGLDDCTEFGCPVGALLGVPWGNETADGEAATLWEDSSNLGQCPVRVEPVKGVGCGDEIRRSVADRQSFGCAVEHVAMSPIGGDKTGVWRGHRLDSREVGTCVDERPCELTCSRADLLPTVHGRLEALYGAGAAAQRDGDDRV